MKIRIPIAAICSLLLLSAAGTAQLLTTHSTTATVHGIVTDPSGAVIPGAMVTLSTPHWTRTLSTDESGGYRLSGIDARTDHHCRITIRYGGFAPFERTTLVLAAGMETEADAQLEVHEVRQSVTVYE
jgi:hypothetical protein